MPCIDTPLPERRGARTKFSDILRACSHALPPMRPASTVEIIEPISSRSTILHSMWTGRLAAMHPGLDCRATWDGQDSFKD